MIATRHTYFNPTMKVPYVLGIRGLGLGCSDPLAENANSDPSIPCVYGSTAAPTPTYVPGNQPNVTGSGGYEPVDSLTTYLYQNVVTPAAGSPTGTYVDPSLMATMLAQAALEYCQGVSYGGPNQPCAGSDINSIVQQLTDTYSAQVASKGGVPTVGAGNAPGYVYTQYSPGYNSGGPGLILLPNGQSVPNTPANLVIAQQQYQGQIQSIAQGTETGGSVNPTGSTTGSSGSTPSTSNQTSSLLNQAGGALQNLVSNVQGNSTVASVESWVQGNMLLALGIAVGAYFLFFRKR